MVVVVVDVVIVDIVVVYFLKKNISTATTKTTATSIISCSRRIGAQPIYVASWARFLLVESIACL